MKANTTIRSRIIRAVEALRAACAVPASPEMGDAAAAAERLRVPLHARVDAAPPILVTSTMTGSFTVIDCALTGSRRA